MNAITAKLSSTTKSDGFGLFSLLWSLVSALAVTAFPENGLWIILVGLIPWVVQMLAGKWPFKRTALDIPLGIFMITAGASVWTSYDRPAAWVEFWKLVASVLVYYAITSQPQHNLTRVVWTACVVSAILSAYFLFSFDWIEEPLRFQVLNRIGELWMQVRPNLGLPILNSDTAGAIIALLFPLNFVVGLDAIRRQNFWKVALAFVLGLISYIGLVLTLEIGAWIALILGAIILTVAMILRWLGPLRAIFRSRVFIAGFVIVVIAGLFAGLVLAGGLNTINQMSSDKRIAEYTVNEWNLMLDYPWLGGGLSAFSGLYSSTILRIPHLFFSSCHNLFISVGIEQGWIGLLSFVVCMGLSLAMLKPSLSNQEILKRQLGWALGIGMMVMIIQGLTEDVFHCNVGIVGLWVIPGMITLLHAGLSPQPVPEQKATFVRKILAVSLIVVLCVGTAIYHRQILGSWYANLAAIAMDKVQLEGWPNRNERSEVELSFLLIPADRLVEQALEFDPENVSALYHKGVITARNGDTASADMFLGKAYEKMPSHRGIRKAYGYNLAWLNETDDAADVLKYIPEAATELETYAWWWGTQDRADLSERASEVSRKLALLK